MEIFEEIEELDAITPREDEDSTNQLELFAPAPAPAPDVTLPIEEPTSPTVAETVPIVEEPVAPPIEIPTEFSTREQALLQYIENLSDKLRTTGVALPDSGSSSTDIPQAPNFLEGTDLEEAFGSVEGFNKILASVYQRAVEDTRKALLPDIDRRLSTQVVEQVQQQNSLREQVDGFFAENPDLAVMRRTVAAVATEVAKEKPDLTLPEVFAESATRTRQMLHLPSPAPNTPKSVDSTRTPAPKPAFVAQRGSSTVRASTREATVKTIADEIEELAAF